MKFVKEPAAILKEIGIHSPVDIDLKLVAFHLGAQVKAIPLNDCEGYIIGTNDRAIISINSNASETRQRFSLGHEIGHWVNDRGKNLTYRCDSNDMNIQSGPSNNFRAQKEIRANKFASQLLMPKHILEKHLRLDEVNWAQVIHIADTFNVSYTAAAIRLVEFSDLPCMLISWGERGQRNWFVRGCVVPESLWPHRHVNISNFNQGDFSEAAPREVDSDTWIEGGNTENYTLIEYQFFNGYEFLTLIWWKDERQLLDAS